MQEIKIQTKLTQEKYIRLMYVLTYRKPMMVFLTILGLIMLVMGLLSVLGIFSTSQTPYLQLIFGAVMTLYTPFFLYRNAKKQFQSHAQLQETILYTFSPAQMHVQTESSNITSTWDKVYKVQELKDWFLIYQSNLVANLIPKSEFTPDQLHAFRQIVSSVPNLKAKLKKNPSIAPAAA